MDTSHNFQLNYGTGKFLTKDVADTNVYAILRGNLHELMKEKPQNIHK